MNASMLKSLSLAAVIAASLSACAGPQMTQSQRNTAVGAFIGGVALGGVIGSQLNGGQSSDNQYNNGYRNW